MGHLLIMKLDKLKRDSRYFKFLSRTILQHIEHAENKFVDETRVFQRKLIHAMRPPNT